MGAVGVGVPYSMNHRHVAPVIQFLDGGQGRIESHLVVQGQNSLGRYVHRWAIIVIEGVAVGHDGIHIVVAAGKLEDNQNRVFVGGGHGIASFF